MNASDLPPRLYLDNAVTSFPKAPGVADAVHRYLTAEGVSLGRATTRAGEDLARRVGQLRQRAARWFNAGPDGEVVFTFSGTDSLNTVLHGFLRPGDHVVTTDIEHNSVLRPLDWWSRRGVSVTHVSCDAEGRVSPDDVRGALRAETRLVAVSHASNVTGTIQPVADFAAAAHQVRAKILVDASQSAGHLPIDVSAARIDFLACSGHKGLLGPLGTGLLVMNRESAEQLESFRQGGTGTESESAEQPRHGPEKFEAGNHNSPGLVGLGAAFEWIESQGIEALRRHELELTERLLGGLAGLPHVRVPGPAARERVGVVSLTVEGIDSRDVAAILDADFGIEVRAGLHCAPRIHERLGTVRSGGTIRISAGFCTTGDEIDRVTEAIAAMSGS